MCVAAGLICISLVICRKVQSQARLWLSVFQVDKYI